MKRINFTITLNCREDVPPDVIEWMAVSLLQHAETEFASDFDPAFVGHSYASTPIEDVTGSELSIAEVVPFVIATT